MEDLVSIATRFAIKRAKHRKSPRVTKDDLLMGLFQAIAHFDIVKIGPLAIDLEEPGEASGEASQDENDKTINKRWPIVLTRSLFLKERHVLREKITLRK